MQFLFQYPPLLKGNKKLLKRKVSEVLFTNTELLHMARQCVEYSMFCPTDAALLRRVTIQCNDELRTTQSDRAKHMLPTDSYVVIMIVGIMMM
jgi:hypothetical protein